MASSVVCIYLGRDDECQECGGFNETGSPFCSPECAADQAERVAEMDAERNRRRAADDAFAVAVEKLRAQGLADEEIDSALVGMP